MRCTPRGRTIVSASDLGRQSCHVRIDVCGERIGKQDQYEAAFGGLSFIRFERDGSVIVEPIICRREAIDQLERSMLMFYTGVARSAFERVRRDSLREQATARTASGRDWQLPNQRMVRQGSRSGARSAETCLEQVMVEASSCSMPRRRSMRPSRRRLASCG